MSSRTMLVTGATGVVGHELLRSARERGWQAVGCSARGGADAVAWRMAAEPAPEPLRRRWDVVVHAAARPRWNMPPDEAEAANVRPVAALHEVVDADTHVVHVSTAFATGRRGDVSSADQADFRNSYEWSKAAAERAVRTGFGRATIVRPPLVVGRRCDGYAARFSGLYSVLGAAVTGMLPAFIGEPDAPMEIVTSCDVAKAVLDAAEDEPGGAARVLGRGASVLTVQQTIDTMYAALNQWRERRGLPELAVAATVTPEQWHRFFLPFSRPHLTQRQLHQIDLLSEFIPYMSMDTALPVSHPVADVTEGIAVAVRHWADRLPRLAGGSPRPWVGQEQEQEMTSAS